MLDSPIFLVGAERSGSTLLRLMLDSHPEIAFLEEFEYVVDLVDDAGNRPTMEEFKTYLDLSRVFSTSGFEFDGSKTYDELVDSFLVERKTKSGASIVGGTIHFGFSKALSIWPNARFIHLLRDPRDVASSCVAMGWSGNVWHGATKWIEAEDEWAAVDAKISDDRHHTVLFSDLVQDHVSTLTKICGFLGVEYTEEMLAYAATTDYDVPDGSAVERWRGDMPGRDVQLVEARVGRQRLDDRGFELSGRPALEIDGKMLRWLDLTNRVGRVRARIADYGFRLTMQDLVARTFKLSGLRRSAMMEFNEISAGRRKKSWTDGADADR